MASIPHLRCCARRALAVMFLGTPMVVVAATAKTEALFFRRVLPLMQKECLACPGKDEAMIKGGLNLRTHAAFLLGGDSGPSVLPGKIAESSLLLAVGRQSEGFESKPPTEFDPLPVPTVAVPGGNTAHVSFESAGRASRRPSRLPGQALDSPSAPR